MAPGGWRWGPVAAVAAVALGVTGWGLLVAAVAAGVWGMGGGQSSAVTAVIVTRGLWSDCATDASGVMSCVPLVSLVTLPGYLQGSRALAVLGAALGALGVTLGGCAGPRRGPRAAGGRCCCWQAWPPWAPRSGSGSAPPRNSSTPTPWGSGGGGAG
ncbi:claudin-7-like, partial [Poecile atricapillus]|uniref:claudin-7-like n=1 Tax=Poecile atricapillus TaxID=48891 RepID=UPI0027390E13